MNKASLPKYKLCRISIKTEDTHQQTEEETTESTKRERESIETNIGVGCKTRFNQ